MIRRKLNEGINRSISDIKRPVRRSLSEGRALSTSRNTRARKLQESGKFPSIYDSILDELSYILVGAFCYGDDGENAEIDKVFFGRNYVPMIQYTQEDGCVYTVDLPGYLGAIDIPERDMKIVERDLERMGVLESKSIRFKKINKINESESSIRRNMYNTRKRALNESTVRSSRKKIRTLA